MDYEEAIECTISRKTAYREIKIHHADWQEFIAEVGDKNTYTGAEVLNWLGY